MLSKAIVENKIVFFNPFIQTTILPIILGVIIACLLSSVISFNQSNNDITSNIMLRHKVVVKCEQQDRSRGRTGAKRRYFGKNGCPTGWYQIR